MTEMIFEGRSERDAVAKAAAELGSESFDVEILEKSSGLFNKSKVRIRVRPLDGIPDPMGTQTVNTIKKDEPEETLSPPPDVVLQNTKDFVENLISHMGYSATVTYREMNGSKAIFDISSGDVGILIGKKGKNIDALQLLVNSYFIRLVEANDTPSWRIVLDSEGYRDRREETLVRMTQRLADEVSRTNSSRLMEPLNPFERRLVHTVVSQQDEVVSKSEGEGLYKRVRIISTKAADRHNRRRR